MAEKVFSFQKSNMVFEEGDEEDEEVGVLDDSDEDPTFDMVEETRSALSKISLKKSKRRSSRKGSESGNEDGLESADVVIPELDEKDGRCFEIVEKLIKDGQVAKLKVDQCKLYLRKYGLRLTGNKEVLLGRIREHLKVKDGGGEKKYPASSFVLNCKGDACTGDIVMFEQKVYEMYNIASRSATGPPCGTRIVAGRIVKESYGAAKQQHTFTIEVLWSKGEKPLPPLHPLLIKGRNLYRLKTMRQRWTDEEQRRKILQEKHARGSIARCNRDDRIQEKETKRMGNMKRIKENKGNHILEGQENKQQGNPVQRTVLQQPKFQSSQQPQPHPGLIKSKVAEQPVEQKYPEHYLNCFTVSKPCQGQLEGHKNPPSKIVVQQPKFKSLQQSQHHPGLIRSEISEQQKLQHSRSRSVEPNAREHCVNFYPVSKPYHEEAEAYHNNRRALQPRPRNLSSSRADFHPRQPQYHQHHWQNTYYSQDRQALESFNSFEPCQNSRYVSPEQELCRYYRQGRCYFGENCKYLHVYNQLY